MAAVKTIITIILFALAELAIGQSREDFDRLRPATPHDSHVHKHAPADYRNEFSRLISFAFHFYSSFISSQDASTCMFTPSCSAYASRSIEKYGIVRGSLATFDRLTRCNGLARRQYPVDPNTRLSYDPVP
jgi:uncharacterized protein